MLFAIAIFALAGAAIDALAAHAPASPTIVRISRSTLWPGAKITISGRNFVPGSRRNVVIFLGGPGRGDDFKVRATSAPKATRIVLTAPRGRTVKGGSGATSGKLQIENRHGLSKPSRFAVSFDNDRDGIPNEREIELGTDPTKADTDGDGVPDGSDPDPLHASAPSLPSADVTPPDTAIDSAPHGTTPDPTPVFEFHSDEPGSTFECSIDSGSPSFGPCSGPGATHTPALPLAPGAHIFRVRAVDAAGNVDPSPADELFTVAEVRSCASPGVALAGAGLSSTFEGIENIISEGRSVIGHGAYGGAGFVELCLRRKKLGDPDSTYQLVRASSSPAAGTLIDGQRPAKGTDYVFRTDVVTPDGHIPGADTVIARGAASVAASEGWAELEENCTQCGSSSIQAGSLRSTVKSEGTGPGEDVGEVAVYKGRLALGWHPGALPEHPEQAGTDVTARVLVPVSTSTPGTHIGAQLNLSVQHPATMRDEVDGTAVDLRDSSLPWISVEVRRNADGTIVVLARDSAGGGPDNVIAETGDLTAEGLQNVYITVQMASPSTYMVRYKPNTEEFDSTLDLNGGEAGTDRALPGPMPEAWLSLTNEMSRGEVATHDVRFDDISASYQTDYRDLPQDSFGGVGTPVQLPGGFSADVIAGEVKGPTAVAFAPNGDMYIALRDGRVKRLPHGAAMSPGNASVEEVLDIEDLVNSGPNDHGITAIALDPSFESNGFLYLYYTVQKADTFEDRTVSRVERFHVGAGGTIDREDALNKVLVGTDDPAPDTGDPATNNTCPPGPTSDCLPSDHYTHSSGGLQFGSDGKLWISTPDGATPEGLDAGGSDHLSMRAVNPNSLAGKILRVDPSTGNGVPGNPNYNGSSPSSPQSRIWAMGFRNPFRIAERPNSPGSWYAGDVGWGAWEEVDKIPGTASAGVVPNYGWPCHEGPDPSIYMSLFPAECGFPNPIGPLYAYDSSGVDHAIIGGAFYTGSAYPAPWKPSPGEAAFYYADYPTGDVTMVKTDGSDQIISPGGVQAFGRGFREPVMITEGPVDRSNPAADQALYLVDLGPRDQAEGRIWRITYEGP